MSGLEFLTLMLASITAVVALCLSIFLAYSLYKVAQTMRAIFDDSLSQDRRLLKLQDRVDEHLNSLPKEHLRARESLRKEIERQLRCSPSFRNAIREDRGAD